MSEIYFEERGEQQNFTIKYKFVGSLNVEKERSIYLPYDVFSETGWVFSRNLAHKCCKAAGIRSKARKCGYKAPGAESLKFENVVSGHWNAAAPLEIVVSDMTTLRSKGKQWEWTLLLDTFNNEILAHKVDFGLADADDVPALLDSYVHFFNCSRPAAALGYKSPAQYKTVLGFP